MNLTEYLKLYKIHLIKTSLCFLTFMSLGGCSTLLGSSLLDIQIRVREPYEKVTGLIPSRAIGYMIGGVIAALIETKLEPNLVLFCANSTGAIFIGLAPWFFSYWPIYSCFFISGIAQGVLDIFVNTYSYNIWGLKAANYIQVLHSSFGLGSLLTPLLTKGFLLPSTNETLTDDETFALYSPEDVKVQYAFLVISIVLFSSSLGFLLFYLRARANRKTDDFVNKEIVINNVSALWKRALCIAIVALVANCSFGLQTLVGSLGPPFAVKSDLHMSKQDGASLVTVFWFLYTFYRYVHLGLLNVFKERRIMIFSYTCVIISAFVMAPHAAYSRPCIWISFVLLGAGYSPTFTVALSTLQRYFYLSGRNASYIFIVGVTGESIHPWILTKLMQSSQVYFVYYLAIMSSIQVALCFILPIVCNKIFKPDERKDFSRTESFRSFTR
ncbi:sodium-dependent glucose transporter 1-like [Panonychus citri]|uniref:sodium-dependent glucose transporter 1-like n=1 Tax=Panonychus citri TaxID=50023 RepID=UPI002307FB2F|nr:sodium-dependent glucose transporter 1-like [Panonychus citri]